MRPLILITSTDIDFPNFQKICYYTPPPQGVLMYWTRWRRGGSVKTHPVSVTSKLRESLDVCLTPF